MKLVYLDDREHTLLVHLLRSGLERGFFGSDATRDLLATIEGAQEEDELPIQERKPGWLARWRHGRR